MVLPDWISKFLSVKMATLILSLYFINGVDCEASLKVTAIAGVSATFIIAKTIQNILLGDKEAEPPNNGTGQ